MMFGCLGQTPVYLKHPNIKRPLPLDNPPTRRIHCRSPGRPRPPPPPRSPHILRAASGEAAEAGAGVGKSRAARPVGPRSPRLAGSPDRHAAPPIASRGGAASRITPCPPPSPRIHSTNEVLGVARAHHPPPTSSCLVTTQLDRAGRRIYTTGTGQRLINLHSRGKCSGEPCVIHHPSDHSMRSFPTHWRRDRRIMERICPHGVGHPDPDHMAFYAKRHTPEETSAEATHGCDGCCDPGRPTARIVKTNSSRLKRWLPFLRRN